MITKEELLKEFKTKIETFTQNEKNLIIKAFEFADKYHQGQKRHSGEEFIIHPLAVAIYLTKMNVDYEMIIAALLHDVVEDTEATLDQVASLFGQKVANLVDGVTKISKLKPTSTEDKDAETIRKMLLAMIKDIKIIIIKLADKLHNMETLNYLPANKRKIIALQTLDIYAPLAGKIGMHFIKDQLEDLALRWTQPEAFEIIKSFFDRTEKDRDRTKQVMTHILSEKLKGLNIPVKIKSRTKHYYSIYKKMKKYNKRIEEIFDLYGVRIITDTVANCYQIFGIIHSLWQPIPERFRDFIANPKKNGYRSLHTTVILERRKAVEIQIRTEEMDEINEYGVAAHWYYKKGEKPSADQLKWLSKLMDVHKEELSPDEYYQTLRDDILSDEIYIFSPKGDIYEMPKGATPIDFAYRVHSEVGHKCKGAKANGMIIPLDTPLKNGMIVEILTGKIPNPKESWISIVKTSQARKKIKSFLAVKKLEELDQQKHQDENNQQKIVNIPKKASNKTASSKKKTETKISVAVNGEKNLLFNFANCCAPSPHDPIVGYISRGRGIIIHKADCFNLKNIKDIEDRIIDVNWVD